MRLEVRSFPLSLTSHLVTDHRLGSQKLNVLASPPTNLSSPHPLRRDGHHPSLATTFVLFPASIPSSRIPSPPRHPSRSSRRWIPPFLVNIPSSSRARLEHLPPSPPACSRRLSFSGFAIVGSSTTSLSVLPYSPSPLTPPPSLLPRRHPRRFSSPSPSPRQR